MFKSPVCIECGLVAVITYEEICNPCSWKMREALREGRILHGQIAGSLSPSKAQKMIREIDAEEAKRSSINTA